MATEQRANARYKLAHAEGFGNVIIGAKLESDDTVGFFASCCQHENWHTGIFVVTARLTADLQTVQSGQHQVENHEIGILTPHFCERQASIGYCGDAEALFLQVIPKQFDNITCVFDDEYLL